MNMLVDTDLIRSVKGFLDPEEGERLYQIGLEASAIGPCLEIGSYCGKSACYLGSACKKNDGILFSIDHHLGSEEQQAGEEYFDPELFEIRTGSIDTLPWFRKTIKLAGLEETVVPMVCSSEVAAKSWATPLSFVFIDGGHAYDTVYRDYVSWRDHIMAGGFLAIHDIFENPAEGGQAPYQIYRLALDSGMFHALPMTKTLGVLQRTRK